MTDQIIVEIEESYKASNGHMYCKYKCFCGKEFIARRQRIESKQTKSCGCLKGSKSVKHGYKYTRTYGIWNGVLDRCLNRDCKDYPNYGGRGIEVCDDWLEFTLFLRDMGEAPDDKTIDRINNDGSYCKENCRWATNREQQNNKRNTIYLTDENGITKPLTQWARERGVGSGTFYDRRLAGWSDLEILER